MYLHYIFFIQSCVDGRLGCLHILAIVNRAALNTGVQISWKSWFNFVFIMGHRVVLFLIFLETHILFSIMFVHSQQHYTRVPFPPDLSDYSHSNRCEVISHWYFDWVALIISVTFSYTCRYLPFVCLFWEISI